MAKYRKVADERNLLERLRFPIIQQSADRETLSFGQFHFRVHVPHRHTRHREALYADAIGVVERAHFRRHLQLNRAAWRNRWNEIQTNSELPELNRNCGRAARRSALHYG